jgi:chromate transporter
VVTYFTFLPSFLFIISGRPLVESTHGNLKFTSPLAAITASVVGVIMNLALFFAYHIFWPQDFMGRFDVIAAAITSCAFLALVYYKKNVISVLLVCAVVGSLYVYAKPFAEQLYN